MAGTARLPAGQPSCGSRHPLRTRGAQAQIRGITVPGRGKTPQISTLEIPEGSARPCASAAPRSLLSSLATAFPTGPELLPRPPAAR
jgi:hypothetical protein